jgi:hypothetical protein
VHSGKDVQFSDIAVTQNDHLGIIGGQVSDDSLQTQYGLFDELYGLFRVGQVNHVAPPSMHDCHANFVTRTGAQSLLCPTDGHIGMGWVTTFSFFDVLGQIRRRVFAYLDDGIGAIDLTDFFTVDYTVFANVLAMMSAARHDHY